MFLYTAFLMYMIFFDVTVDWLKFVVVPVFFENSVDAHVSHGPRWQPGGAPMEKAMATHSSTLAWKIRGRRSLVGRSPCGREESDTTEAT